MDFFQAQDNAIRKTKQLVFYYLVAVVLIIMAVYMAVTFGYLLYEYLLLPDAQKSFVHLETPVWEAKRFIVVSASVVLLVGLGSLFKTLSLRGGGATVATSLGGELVDRSTRDPKRRQLLNVVEEMAIASGVPVPEVYILKHESSINAFAAGWSKDDAVIAVSAGALERLSRDELQGVVAHEYSHVLYGDCRLNIRLMGVLYGIMMLTIFGQMMRLLIGGGGRHGRGMVIVGGGRRRSSNSKGGGGAIILVVIVVIILITVIGYIGSFFGRLIQAAISRQREFLADAAAVQFTRNPEGISGALKKINLHAEKSVLVHPKASEAAHMFFADGIERSLSSALATHPPLKERILKIQPNWDGKYDSVRQRSRQADRSKAGTRASTGQPTGKDFIEGMAILGAVGTLNSGNLDTARQIRQSIPESLDEQMRQPEGARHSILALVIADNPADDQEQLKLVDAALPGDAAMRIREAVSQISNLPRDARLGILELSASTLAQSPGSMDQSFFDLVEKLIHVDDTTSLYEFCLRRILRERLQRAERASPADTSVQYMMLKQEVAKAVGALLSVIVRKSEGQGAPPERFEKSLKGLYLLQGKVVYQEPDGKEIESLDAALDVLRQAAYAIRAQLLRAVVACIEEDGQLSPEEAEILRALCLSLDCPAPPLTHLK